MPYDQRLYSFSDDLAQLSLATLAGRVKVPTVIGPYFRAALKGKRGQADLVSKKGKLFFYVSVEVPEATPVEATQWLGVRAAPSDGHVQVIAGGRAGPDRGPEELVP